MRERHLEDYFPVAPRVRYEVSFESPLFFGQEVTTHLAVTAIGTTSMTFAFEVWGEPHGGRGRARAAHGSFVTVHLDRGHAAGASSTPWPSEWREALAGPPDRRGQVAP
jgi:acyl-CoA thioester hydrolase